MGFELLNIAKGMNGDGRAGHCISTGNRLL
jgi:hypothetical protein